MSRLYARKVTTAILTALSVVVALLVAGPTSAQVTTVTEYFDDRDAAMALNYDTELYLCGMIHSNNGYDPPTAAARAGETRVGWPNIIDDCETYGIPVSFNICGHEAVFGDNGPGDLTAIDITHSWHSDAHWSTNTWYSDAPPAGGNYLTVGDLSGTTRSYGLVYGGDLTERTMNSAVPFEISYHNFGHESLSDITETTMDDTFSLGVDYHKRIGSKLTAEAPPWNNNPLTSGYPIYVQNGIYVFNRMEGATGVPYEAIADLWVVPRNGAFDASTDLTSQIDAVITAGHVLAPYSHPEDGFESVTRTGFQTSLAYAQAKVASGELWATTLSEIGRYWEAKSDVSTVTQINGTTTVDVTLTGYDVARFGIPYLTFKSPMPNGEAYARITVDYPSSLVLNSESSTVRVVGGEAIYTIYLNPAADTHVQIEGVATPHTGGVDINTPVLTVDSTPPVGPLEATPITIQATTTSTDALYTVNLIYQRNSDAKGSAIMVDNAGTWETQIGPFTGGDSVTYYVSATDNSGRRITTADQNFVVQAGPDLTDPEWQLQGQSESNPEQGTPVQLYAEGRDETALRYARLETDETGSWAERTQYGSPMNLGDVANTWTLSSFTWDDPAITIGTIVSWRIRYEDATGNEVVTDTMSFTVEAPFVDTEAPLFFDPSVDSTLADQPATFSLRWTDNVGLDQYIFSFDNGTGSFVDDPAVAFTEGSGAGAWWDAAWSHRRTITIDNSAGSDALTDHAVLVTVDTAALIGAGKMNTHGGDIRFVDGATELDYWVESGLNSAATRIWVEVPSVAALSSHQIAMYYGNPNRTVPRSNGGKTFADFDDFGGRGWEEFKYGGNPVMGPGSTAGGGGTFSSVMRLSPTSWRMYASYDSDGNDIGLSTSTDGLNWTHQGVVLRKGSAGEWDSGNIWCPAVWEEGGTYYMLHPATGGPDGMQMGLATSPDGITWTKYDDPSTTVAPHAESDPVFNDPNWAPGDTEGPCFSVLKEAGTYYVMYNTLGGHRQSSIVRSTDLINWTPVYSYARFPGGPSTSDWNYNTFCGNVFKYEDLFYLAIPGQDSSRNYAKFGLYVSDSPEFPEADTEFLGVVFTGDTTGWEDEDMDTPWMVQFDGMMHMYYAACGSCWSQTGVAIIPDPSLALAQAYPPGNYIGVDRTITASQQVMPPVGWQKSIAGYVEINSQNFLVTLAPAMTGRSIVQYDANATDPLELYRDTPSLDRGVISVWMRADNTTSGDYDLYLYGDTQTTLAMVGGLGGSGEFHYWNGSFVDTGVPYAADTWYLMQIEFDATTDTYNFVVYDTSFAELVRVNAIAFGGAITAGIDRVMLRTSGTFSGNAHLDDVVVRGAVATEPAIIVGSETDQTFTDAWARATKTLTATPGATVRWSYTASDTSANSTTSDVYSFQTTLVDTPPTLSLNAPDDNHWTSTATVDFRATCSDEYDVNQVSLYGDWGGSWALIDTANGPGINGVEVVFSETVPDGTWTWNVECTDDTANTTAGTVRTLNVDSVPDPWFECGYGYRQRLIVTENSGNALTNYPVFAEIDTAALIAAGKMRSDCADIRVTDNGTEIPSQIVGCDSATTQVWLQTDLSASQVKQGFYLYYGDPAATPPDYTPQTSISWNGGTSTMDTGQITAVYHAAGGIIGQISNNANGAGVMSAYAERGVGYLFSDNPAVWYLFRADETDDSIALTTDGPVFKVVTSYSGETPQWIQESVFYNNQDFVDFRVYRPGAASAELYLTGGNNISPDGVFSAADTDELLRVDDSATDIAVAYDNTWRYNATVNRGYVGIVDPTFTNELAFVWDETLTQDFTWRPRTGAQAGTISFFIGGDGPSGTYGLIDAATFDYRFVLRNSATPDNANTRAVYDYYLTAPPTVAFGPEETPAVDVIAPVITITSPTNTTYQADTVSLAFTASEGLTSCTYTLDGGAAVPLPGCTGLDLTSLANGPHTVDVDATDCAGNPGTDSVSFTVDVQPFPWWDSQWNYRVPITVDTDTWSRTDEPIEHVKNFTVEWGLLGETGLTFDPNSIRVLEYTAAGDLIGEVPSQFDPDPAYDAVTNAVGTLVWIMDGTTAAATTRHYYVYWDSTDNPKAAPAYVTDLDWDGSILSNTLIDATLGTVFSSSVNRTGITSFSYNGVAYTTSGAAGGAGIYYLTSPTSGAVTYDVLIDGPVKKTVRLTPPANGTVTFTLYDQIEWIKVVGDISGSNWSFTVFPYAHELSQTSLTTQVNYFNNAAVVNETLATQGWLNDAPDEGWVCLDGSGANKDLCLITDGATLPTTNNFWRYTSTSHQLIFPTWNPNIAFPINPVAWIVMGDTYQDGQDFWNKLSAPVIHTQGVPEGQCVPVAADDVTCDGVDDDCDGSFDEDYTPTPTSCGVGECAGNAGQLECQSGSTVDTCDPLLGATPEVCDTLDNDCDGLTDDADPDITCVAPTVTSTVPLDAATDVVLGTNVVVNFDLDVDPLTFSGTIDGAPIVATQIVFDVSNTFVTLDLGEMEYGRTHSVVIAGTLESSTGVSMGTDYSFGFTVETNPNPKRPATTLVVPGGTIEAGIPVNLTGQSSGYIWERDVDNPLELRHWDVGGNDVGDRPMLHPTGLHFPGGMDGYEYWLSYTPYPPGANENPVMVRSNDGVNFVATGVPANPLFTYNYQPPYDMQNLADPELYRLGETWMLFYEMETPAATASTIGAWMHGGGYIGLALSSDGLTWEPYGGPYVYDSGNPPTAFPPNGNPVIYPEATVPYENFTNAKSGEIGVFFKDGQFHLWRTIIGGDPPRIAYDTALDPRGPWTKQGLAIQFGGGGLGPHPDVVYDPERDIYLMLVLDPSSGQLTTYTASTPAGPWPAHPLNPVFSAQGGWEGTSLYRATYVRVNGQWYMYYSGNPGSDGMIGLAREVSGVRTVEVSTDGGSSWAPATVQGDGSWSFSWTPVYRDNVIQARVTDDFMVGDPSEVEVNNVVNGAQPPPEQPVTVDCGAQTVLDTPAAPILVVTDSSYVGNPFGCYLTEILRGEGLVEFQHAELSLLLAETDPLGYVSNFDVVLLAEMSLDATQELLFRDYVTAGGNLIAMRPDVDLEDMFGLTYTSARTEQLLQFFAVDTAIEPGVGIVDLSLQYHGEADDYTLAGATELATLYDDIATASTNPAVTLTSYGSGQAAAFTFDLARSIVLMRQGNPAWADTEGDGTGGYRPTDMFRRTTGENYIEPTRFPVPQADEKQRFLANLILTMVDRPLPRMWYLPDKNKAMMVNTGDAEGLAGASLEGVLDDIEVFGGFFSHYLMTAGINGTTVAEESDWRTRGHETGIHASGPDSDYNAYYTVYENTNNSLIAKFGHGARTARNHTIDWVGWSEMAEIMAAHGTGMDTNYYHIPYYLGDPLGANGYFTGSGLPQRFSDENGVLLGIYQALTEWPDEWFDNNGLTAAQAEQIVTDMLVAAENGYYSAFVNNIHPVRYNNTGGDITNAWANAVWAYCQTNGIPLWSAEMLLDFVEARNRSTLENITWAVDVPSSTATLTFDFSAPWSGMGLTLMIPVDSSQGSLLSVDVDSAPATFTAETIKGRTYALVTTNDLSDQVVATYGLDTTSPVISNVQATGVTDQTATVTWDTDEAATSEVNYGTTSGNLTLSQSVPGYTTGHSVPLSNLVANTTYYYEVTSLDQAGNPATSVEQSFTTGLPRWTETTDADFSDGTSNNVEVIGTPDACLRLGTASGLFDHFEGTTLDTGTWLPRNWSTGGATDVTVAGSHVTVGDVTYIRSNPTFFQETVEGLVTLNDGANAHFGWATAIQAGDDGVTDPHWAMFSVRTGQFLARTRLDDGQGTADGEINTVIAVQPGVPHNLRVVWNPDDSIEFWVDGYLEATHNRAFAAPMRVYLSSGASPQTAVADYVDVSGAFELSGDYESSVFDSGGTADWDQLTWNGVEPAGTTVAFDTRSGSTASPDGTWSAWEAVVSDIVASPDSQYVQYRALLTTSDDTVTPQVCDVTVTYTPGPDTSPPIVSSTDPMDLAVDVAVTTDVTINYNEPIVPGTFNATISGGATFTTTFSNGDRTVVLDPDVDLDFLTAYTVTVDPGVEDITGNPTAGSYTFDFTTAVQSACWLETTQVEFDDGTFTNTVSTLTGDGEVSLATLASFSDGFTEPDGPAANWTPYPASGDLGQTPVWNVTSNVYVHELNTGVPTYHPSVLTGALGPSGDFTFEARQRIVQIGTGGLGVLGFVIGVEDTENYYILQWVVGQASVRVYRRDTGGGFTALGQGATADPVVGTWYDLRVEVTGTTFDFYIDDALTFSTGNAAYTPAGIGLLAYDGSLNEYDDVLVNGSFVAGSGTYESSSFDTGAASNYQTLTWVGSEPAGTTVGFETRTSTDGVAWTSWAPVIGGAISSPSYQYVQYRASLTTTDAASLPVVEQVEICYQPPAPDLAPPVIVSTDPVDLATDVPVTTTVTIDFDEPINTATFAATIGGGVTFTTAFLNANATAVLTPDVPLTGLTSYTVTVLAGVEDVAGNPTASSYSFDFTTAEAVCVNETTIADFSDGTFSNTEVVGTGDGAVSLAFVASAVELLNDPFTEPDGPASNWTPIDGTWNIVGGEYDFTIAGSYAVSIVTGQSLDTFIIESRQKIVTAGSVGSGGYVWSIQNPTGPDNWKNGAYMMQWDTRSGALTNVRFFRWDGVSSLSLISEADLADVVLDTWYTLRLEVTGSNFELFIDDVSVLVGSDATYGAGAVGLIGWHDGDTRYDDVVLSEPQSGYSTPGTYTSNEFDLGTTMTWGPASWTGNEPAGTALGISVRTRVEGGSWTPFAPIATSGDPVAQAGRYIQYQADLSTTDPGASSELLDLAINCSACVPTAADDVTCDGVDDDCDGVADEDYVATQTFCGVGECSGNTGQLECQTGSVVDTCDPLFGATPEICDTLDNDCDNLVDDADPDVTGQSTWYADVDGDTFGNAASSQLACVAPVDHVADGTDCDDGDGAVYPGAVEICDGVDNQCTGDAGFGQIDEGGDALCDNLQYCDGAETCGGVGGCLAGTAVDCDDGILCTTDSCNEGTDACDYVPSGSCGVSGTVFYYRDHLSTSEPTVKPVPGVSIDLATGLTSDGTGDAITDVAGSYAFASQAGTLNVSTMPAWGDPPHTGAVSAYDASQVAQHSVGLQTLSLNQSLAGDVTNNGSLSAFDAAKVAQFSVGLITHFDVALDDASDWKFLRCASYPDETAPDCYDPAYVHDPLTQPETDDFYAILYGDVSGDWPAGARGVTEEVVTTSESEALVLDGISFRRLPAIGEIQQVRRAPSSPPAILHQTVRRDEASGGYEVILSLDRADGILALDLDLTFDKAKVRVVGMRTLDLASRFSVASNLDDGRLQLGIFSPMALEGSGSILSIEIAGEVDALDPPFRIAGQANEGEIPVHEKDGRPLALIATRPVAQPGPRAGTDGTGPSLVSMPTGLTVAPGGDVVVPVHVDPADGTQSFDLDFTYDSSVLQPVGAYTTAFTEDFSLFPNFAAAGEALIAMFDTAALSGAGDVVWIVFTAIGPAGSGTDLVWRNAGLNEGAIASTTADGRVDVVAGDTTLSLPDCASGPPGSSIWVPVFANPANGFEGVNVTLQYNASIIEATGVRTTPLAGACSEVHNIDATIGTVSIGLFCTTPISGSGAIVEVAFDVYGFVGDAAPIFFTEARVNEGVIVASTDDGFFVISTDDDSDGFTADCGDCDDGVDTVYPGAPEICDGLDNQCPGDPGFGEIDEGLDSDGDGVADCFDGCPNDPGKTEPGVCGCGVSDVDTDGDTVADCVDPDDDNDGVLDPDDCARLVNSVSETPGELLGLMRIGPDFDQIEWPNMAQANVFNLYRGSTMVTTSFAYNHTCIAQEIPDTRYLDGAMPVSGELIYYLVSGRNSCPGGEGTLGFASFGPERPNDTPCPFVGTADADGDLILDVNDNCPQFPNFSQIDADADGVGDLCDNCPADYDPTQLDTDGDGIGDVCE